VETTSNDDTSVGSSRDNEIRQLETVYDSDEEDYDEEQDEYDDNNVYEQFQKAEKEGRTAAEQGTNLPRRQRTVKQYADYIYAMYH
jgi:hypothetical protein